MTVVMSNNIITYSMYSRKNKISSIMLDILFWQDLRMITKSIVV